MVGHSYAGCMLSGVLAKKTGRFSHAIYPDAFVPQAGQGFATFVPPAVKADFEKLAANNGLVAVPPSASWGERWGMTDTALIAWAEPSQHLLGEEINQLAGTRMLHAPYRGGGAAINNALSGAVPLIIVGARPIFQQVEAKILRAYAVSTKQRMPQLPDVPTFAELGFPQIDASQWFGIAIHADTPKEIAARLHTEIADIVRQPAFAKVLETFGALAASGTAEDWGAFYASEYKNHKALAEKLGIPVQ